jgi:hypothetical protein
LLFMGGRGGGIGEGGGGVWSGEDEERRSRVGES